DIVRSQSHALRFADADVENDARKALRAEEFILEFTYRKELIEYLKEMIGAFGIRESTPRSGFDSINFQFINAHIHIAAVGIRESRYIFGETGRLFFDRLYIAELPLLQLNDLLGLRSADLLHFKLQFRTSPR